jgi:hypothetical protein
MSPEIGRLTSMPEQPPAIDDQVTGLPLLHTWRAVYIFVAIVFVVWVVLLSTLQRMYS